MKIFFNINEEDITKMTFFEIKTNIIIIIIIIIIGCLI